ncbi:MAG: hypothetical protein IJ776_09090 [Paludibacteraceae bacterium]|nr:hypothetical protein [Paludibacteraceae bacterium]
MKRFVTITLTLFLAISSLFCQQPRFCLLGFKGQVSVKHRSDSVWTAPALQSSLSLFDSLCLADNALVKIWDRNTNAVLLYSEKGKCNVNQIRQTVSGSGKSVTKNLIKELSENVLETEQDKTNYSIGGYTTRSKQMAESAEETFNSVWKETQENVNVVMSHNRPVLPDSILLETIYLPDSIFYFSFSNLSAKPVYFNVVRANHNTGRTNMCLLLDELRSQAVLCPPYTRLNLEGCLFAAETGDVFFPVVSPVDFNCKRLQLMLQNLRFP